jgi:predicted NUDIX family phosphoesterase
MEKLKKQADIKIFRGRRLAFRSDKHIVNRDNNDEVVLDEEEIDNLKYLGFIN